MFQSLFPLGHIQGSLTVVSNRAFCVSIALSAGHTIRLPSSSHYSSLKAFVHPPRTYERGGWVSHSDTACCGAVSTVTFSLLLYSSVLLLRGRAVMHFIHRIHWHVHLLTRGRRDKKTSSRTNVHGESAHSIIDSSARTKYTTGATNEEEVAM